MATNPTAASQAGRSNPLHLINEWLNANDPLDDSTVLLQHLWDQYHKTSLGNIFPPYDPLGIAHLVDVLHSNGYPRVKRADVLRWNTLGGALAEL
ncbi:MAG: hypothetical protein ACLPXT_01770 [Terracidiphilus sp.]